MLATETVEGNTTIVYTNREFAQGRDEEHKILDKYRVIPAALTILIFVVGSVSIFFYERKREKKKIALKG